MKNNNNNSEDIYIIDFVSKFKFLVKYFKSKWILISMMSFTGLLIGLCFSIYSKPTYKAVCTFVLEDEKSSNMSQYAGLASLAGINIGSGGGGIFQGDNILELYTSRKMIEKALLSPGTFNGKKQLLIDRYIDFNNLRSKFSDKGQLNFSSNPQEFNRKEDSIITVLVELFNKSILDVSKPDKKLDIIDVEVTSNDELFANFFTNKIVEVVNDFYVQTKTKKAIEDINILQHQADSVRVILNSSISGVASAIDAAPNANPQVLALKVPSQRKQIDVQANSAIYSEMVKNLEMAKISLRRETPLIQLIDTPVLPLKMNKLGKAKGMVVGLFLGLFLSLLYLMVAKFIQ